MASTDAWDISIGVWMLIKCVLTVVVAAGVSFGASLFMRAQHLSKKAEAAVLGVLRDEPVPMDDTQMQESIELRQRRGGAVSSQ